MKEQNRFIFFYSASSIIFAILYWNLIPVTYEIWSGPVGAAIFSGISFAAIVCAFKCNLLKLGNWEKNFLKITTFIEKNIVVLLASIIITYIAWSGLVIFSNPYEIYFNQGDGAAFTQYNYNFINGGHPELSFISINVPVPSGDMRFKFTGPYVSIFFWGATYWLPLLVVPPIYSIYPHPPMHVFAVLVVIVAVGVPGMYFALKKAGGSQSLAFLGAMGYLWLPHVAVSTFDRGYWDYIAFAVFPWVLGFLFARKWLAFYLSCICLAAVGYPWTYTITFIGIVTAVFFKAPIPGLVASLIGLSIMQWDAIVFKTAVLPYYAESEKIPSFLEGFVLNRTIGSLIPPFSFYMIYAGSILQSVGFFQIFGARIDGKWNSRVLGLLMIGIFGFVMLLFRSWDWTFQRNAMLFVPFYVAGLLAYIDWNKHQTAIESQKNRSQSITRQNLGAIVLVCCVTASIVCWTGYARTTHFQRTDFLRIKPSEETQRVTMAINVVNSIIKPEDPIAIMPSLELWAMFTNRQHVWHIGNEPAGVKYYLVIGYPNTNQAATEEWERTVNLLKNNKDLKLIHDTSPAKASAFSTLPIMIFKNLNEQPIARNEEQINWSVLQRAFHVTVEKWAGQD